MSYVSRADLAVSYQGIRGAYSEIAAKHLFPEAELKGQGSFEAVYDQLNQNKAQVAVLPIENTVIGSIFEVYDLLFKHPELQVISELQLKIDHNLLGLAGSDVDYVHTVYSHTKALAQCKKLFQNHSNLNGVVWEDTAAAAAYVSLKQDPLCAAIASKRAAEVYGLEILAEHVQDDTQNFTRFLALTHRDNLAELLQLDTQEQKTSLVFAAAHEPGSLLECMEPFARHNLNLTKIESRPLVGSPWQYLFYLDFEHEPLNGELAAVLEEIKPHTQVLRVLGTYPKGETVEV